MPAPDLIAGPYRAPACRAGDWIDDEIDGRIEVGGWTDAPLPWPRRKKTGRAALILTAELARAVRTESVTAIRHWWGMGATKVWQWRIALGVDTTPGSARIARRGLPPLAAAKGRARAAQPDVRARMAATKRGVPLRRSTRKAIALAMARPRTAMNGDDLKQWLRTLQIMPQVAAYATGISEPHIDWMAAGVKSIPHYLALACSVLYIDLDAKPPASMRAWRLARGWSMQRLAAKLGYEPAMISYTERREAQGKSARRSVLLALCALERGLRPWHQLRKQHRLREVIREPAR